VLTFDDGYDDNYTQAYPILRRHGFVGTFFVLTDSLGQPGYLSWQQLADMSNHDMSIQPHGRTHDDLAMLGTATATWEIAGSRQILEEKLGLPVLFYCYPSGSYTAQTIAILQSNGYEAALGTAYGATHSAADVFHLTRVRIRGGDSFAQFVAKLTTAP
jgi:peptidoglycan/xylan/chitin deacetylase (PgdA/CDA1 family)